MEDIKETETIAADAQSSEDNIAAAADASTIKDSTSTPENAPTLEDRFAAIEDILNGMEQPGVTLDESFALYQRGIAELGAANEILDGIEKKMLTLTEDGGLEEF